MELIRLVSRKMNNSITGGAMIIAIFSILAKVLGLVRDRLLASGFGAGDILDAYYAAFKLPDLIFNTLVLGALSAAFIPVFIELRNGKNNLAESRVDHWQLSSALMNIILLVFLALSTISYIFAPSLVGLIAPGFEGDKFELTVEMTRIMLLSIIFFGVSNVLSGILQSMKRFAMFALAPVMYNLGIILGIVFLVPMMGPLGLAWGVVVGALFHLLIQLPRVIRLGFKWQPLVAFKDKAVRQIGKLMLPRTLGLAGNQVNQLVMTIIASGLASGSLAVFNLAFNLQSVPIGIFAVSLAITAFPAMSESFSLKDKAMFLDRFSITVRRILFLVIPMSIFIIALRAQIVRLVLGAGEFDWQDTILTADALGFFAVSLFAQGLIPLLARAFYAFQNTKIPVLVSLVAVIVNIIGSIILAPRLGVVGLVMAFSVASILQAVMLLVALRQKIGHLDEKKIILALVKVVTATVGATLFIQLTKYMVADMVDMRTYIGVLTQFAAAGIIGSLIYFLLGWMLGVDEIKEMKKFISHKSI